jgi:IMP dehydrogenase
MIDSLSFDDILLVPRTGILESRSDADIKGELVLGHQLLLPLISANMPSVTGITMAVVMANNGGVGAVHRFQSIEDQVKQVKAIKQKNPSNALVSFGVKEEEKDRVIAQEKANKGLFPNIYLLDVAHADHIRVFDMIDWFRSKYPFTHLIVGNVATYAAAFELARRGASGIKVGVGPGAACTTREVTGFGIPQFSAIKRISLIREKYPHIRIIADGGCKNSGDIVKAFAAGADTVMLGRLLAGANEAPKPGIYHGNASKEMNGHHAPEGVSGNIPIEGPVKDILKELAWGIRSGVSYAGTKDLKGLRNVEITRVTPLAQVESGTRL